MIYIGIDDTDVAGSPGTNQLARAIVARLGGSSREAVICRHQLLLDPRIPYTSRNGSASIQLPRGHEMPREALIALVRGVMRAHYVEGSDPGLAVAGHATVEMRAFAARVKTEVVGQADAQAVAARSRCHLEGLGGTNGGVIGALAAIALASGGNDGRVVHVEGWPWPDPFCGPQSVAAVRGRGVAEIRTPSGEPFAGDMVDIGRHLRPSWRGGRIVLFVEPPADGTSMWRARKFA